MSADSFIAEFPFLHHHHHIYDSRFPSSLTSDMPNLRAVLHAGSYEEDMALRDGSSMSVVELAHGVAVNLGTCYLRAFAI